MQKEPTEIETEDPAPAAGSRPPRFPSPLLRPFRKILGPPAAFIRRYPDHFGLTFVTVLAAALRLIRLDIPKSLAFDEVYYAKDACWFVNVSQEICEIDYEQSYVHPPLGKWLIAIGIRIFGHDSFGWRISGAVAGVITVMLVYLLARKILRSSLGAVLAGGLVAIDLLHFVQSRMSMLDIFVPLFGMAAVLFVVYDRDRYRPPPDAPRANGLLDRPWRLAAGACAGAAIAAKWSGLFFLALIVVLTLIWEWSERRADEGPHPLARVLREETLTIVVWLFVFPVAIYALTYAGRLGGPVLEWPWTEGSWWRLFWERQVYMYDFHKHLESSHGYQSNPLTWIALKRPVSYYIEYGPKGEYGEVMATGSPFVWWASVLALVYVAFRWVTGRIRRVGQARGAWRAEGVILAGFVFTYGPWLIAASDRSAVFIFYLLPVVPFMCLALAYVATQIGRTWEAKAAVGLFAAGAIGFFVFYYPIVANVEIPKSQWERRIWVFNKCDKPEPTPVKSTVTISTGKSPKTTVTETSSNESLPPTGWCWI